MLLIYCKYLLLHELYFSLIIILYFNCENKFLNNLTIKHKFFIYDGQQILRPDNYFKDSNRYIFWN